MHSLVKKLEERLLPEFEKVAEKIRAEIPGIIVNVYSSSSGSLTEFQGRDFLIECAFKSPVSETDSIALGVWLCHVTTIPRIYSEVSWNMPSNFTEAEFYEWSGSFTENGLIVSDAVLENLHNDLPRLYNALFTALKRRKPPDE